MPSCVRLVMRRYVAFGGAAYGTFSNSECGGADLLRNSDTDPARPPG